MTERKQVENQESKDAFVAIITSAILTFALYYFTKDLFLFKFSSNKLINFGIWFLIFLFGVGGIMRQTTQDKAMKKIAYEK